MDSKIRNLDRWDLNYT